MKEKTPQEKKALSYAKDCRNTFRENDKASRKAIPRRKKEVNRGYRRGFSKVLKQIDAKISLETAETVEIAARNLKRNDWKKFPDEALGTVIKRKLVRRETHAGNGKTAQKKVREFLANLKIQTEQEVDGRWIAEATELRGVLVYGESREAAVIKYQRLAEVVYLENLGAGKILEVNEEYISIQRF